MSKPSLGRTFYVLFFAPVVSMAVGAACFVIGENHGIGSLAVFGFYLSLGSLAAMLVCSIICAVIVGRRRRADAGMLAFVGIQVFYMGIVLAGCATISSTMHIH